MTTPVGSQDLKRSLSFRGILVGVNSDATANFDGQSTTQPLRCLGAVYGCYFGLQDFRRHPARRPNDVSFPR